MDYSLQDIADVCGGRFVGSARRVTEVAIDSRTPGHGPHTLFAAIRTGARDGHRFIGKMYERGVRAFLVDTEPDTKSCPEAGFVVADDTVRALQALAAHHRDGFKGTLVAVAGSNGKTVVKEWIAQLAPAGVRLVRSPGSYNSQIGVPLSVLLIDSRDDVAVMEAGVSQPGEMQILERILRPDVGVFTSIGSAHQENFETLEQKAVQKAQLFRGCRTVIYNGEYELLGRVLQQECPRARLVDSSALRDVYDRMPDEVSGRNAAQAVALWDLLFPGGHESMLGRLDGLQPVAMRMELLEGAGDSVIINDTYNSDINSLGMALDYLCRVAEGRRKVLILSDILENGIPDSELYASVARMVAQAGVVRLEAVGPRIGAHASLFGCQVRCFDSADEFLRSMSRGSFDGCAVLVKGNRSSGCEAISRALERSSHTTVLEVDLDAMVHNLKQYRKMLGPDVRLTAMVKASGYGHGTFEIASTLRQSGVDMLAVAFADEGVTLRREGIDMPVLVLNADAGSFGVMVQHDLEPEIYSPESLAEFISETKRYGRSSYPIHVKIDSGMHRLGFTESQIPELLQCLADNSRYVHVRSVFSHLAAADEQSEDEYTLAQIDCFRRACDALQTGLGYAPLRHIAATAAMERFPQARMDMCRLGIGLYGFGMPGLRPIASLKTRIVRIAPLEAGQTVGYGRAGVITRPSLIATVPVGYADGLNRRLGQGRWAMTVNGCKAPIVGRICMDSCMIDVTDVPQVRQGDTVTVFSAESGCTAADMARVLETIPYEVLTGISSRVKRVYIKE